MTTVPRRSPGPGTEGLLTATTAAAVLAGLVACPAPARPEGGLEPADKVQLPGVIRELAARVAAADRLAADQHWQERRDGYSGILRENGDDLVPVDAGGAPLAGAQRFVQARWLVHQRVTRLPPAAWKAFRHRMDGPAKKWLDEAGTARDADRLRRV